MINLFVTHFVCRVINPIIPKDETTADKEIPKAGATTLFTMGLIIIVGLAIVMYRKNKKYEDIR